VFAALRSALALASGSLLAVSSASAGQSNMEGQANIETFDYLGDDPATAPLLKKMRGPDGKPRICDHAWISYFTGLSDGTTVTTWTDMSGLGNHATAAGTLIYKTGVLNGQPVVRFNGACSFATANLSSLFPTTIKNP
jgi:hypothetical protein